MLKIIVFQVQTQLVFSHRPLYPLWACVYYALRLYMDVFVIFPQHTIKLYHCIIVSLYHKTCNPRKDSDCVRAVNWCRRLLQTLLIIMGVMHAQLHCWLGIRASVVGVKQILLSLIFQLCNRVFLMEKKNRLYMIEVQQGLIAEMTPNTIKSRQFET